MPDQPRDDTADLGPTAKEQPSSGPGLQGQLTYVLCYDDIGQDSSAVVASLASPRTELFIGRGSRRELRDGMLRLPDSFVARRQAVLRLVADGWRLQNLSHRGTWVNGKPITETCLQDGDLIEVGHCLLVFRWVTPQEAESVEPGRAEVLAGPTRTLCPELRRLTRDLLKVAPTNAPLLLLGETGAGKDVIARFIHDKSGRGPFEAINCAAIPESLFESTLFGHVRGAFSDAKAGRLGLIRSADMGTVFLDEIGEIPTAVQAKLLRVLEEQKVTPVGSDEAIRIDVRFLAATNVDVRANPAAFRADLLARLGSFVAEIPPLRRRRDDLGILVANALEPAPRHAISMETDAARELFFGELAGNIRVLHQGIRTAATLASPGPIERSHLARAFPLGPASPRPSLSAVAVGAPVTPGPAELEGNEGVLPGDPAVDDRQPSRDTLANLLKLHGSIRGAAGALEVTERTVSRWMRKFGLEAPGRKKR